MTGPLPSLSRLPIRVRCFAGEGLGSYSRRLSAANHTTISEIERALKTAGHRISAGRNADDRKQLWRALGGLHWSAFTAPTEVSGEIVFERNLCLHCCTGISARGRVPHIGNVCLDHQRWVTETLQFSVRGTPNLAAAERSFRRVLGRRSVLVDNPAYLLAQECSTAVVPRAVRADRAAGTPDLPAEGQVYPETVSLAILLTDSRFLDAVLRTPGGTERFALVDSAVRGILPYPDAPRAVNRVWDVMKGLYERSGSPSPDETGVRDPWNLLRHWSGTE